MSQIASGAPIAPVWRTRLELLQREVVVGVPAALTMLAASLAGGVLVCGALGPDYVAFGAAAGISGALFGGASACLIAANSMILWGPLVTIGLVQASLVATLMADPLFANNPSAVVLVLVPNIMDAFGKDWFEVREGEASVFKPDGSGGYKLIVRIQANEWAKLAQASN